MKTVVLYIASVIFALSSYCKPVETGASPGEWTMDFEAARKVAAEKKLPIFINFTGSDWCVWCKHMEKEVFSKKEWENYARDSLMLVWIDFPQDRNLVPEKYRNRNQQLSTTFGIEGYPTYIILDDNGKDQLGLLRAEQNITPPGFISKVKSILIEREESIKQLIAGMPAKEGSELKSACEERASIRKELNTLSDREKQLNAKLTTLESRIKDMRTKALLDKLSPAKASLYRNADKELTAKRKELTDWIATQPKQNEDNQKKFESMSSAISELEMQINSLLYAE